MTRSNLQWQLLSVSSGSTHLYAVDLPGTAVADCGRSLNSRSVSCVQFKQSMSGHTTILKSHSYQTCPLRPNDLRSPSQSARLLAARRTSPSHRTLPLVPACCGSRYKSAPINHQPLPCAFASIRRTHWSIRCPFPRYAPEGRPLPERVSAQTPETVSHTAGIATATLHHVGGRSSWKALTIQHDKSISRWFHKTAVLRACWPCSYVGIYNGEFILVRCRGRAASRELGKSLP